MPQPSTLKLTNDEATKLLTGPGSPFELVEQIIDDEKYRVFKNQIPSYRAAWETTKQFADRDYIVLNEERYTYQQAHKIVATLAHILVNKYHVKKGERVGILMRNLPEWIFAWWATLSVGIVCVPLNSWLTAKELEFVINDCGCKVLLTDIERLERISPLLAKFNKVESIIVTRSNPTALAKIPKSSINVETWEDVFSKAPAHNELPNATVLPDDDSVIMYTSGTTGVPKGALSSHRQNLSFFMSAQVSTVRMMLRRGEPLVPPPPNAPQVKFLLPVPLMHATGNVAVLTSATLTGAKIVLMNKWDAEDALRLIQREKITNIISVPTMLLQIVEHPNISKYDLSSLVSLGTGGAPAPAELVHQVGKHIPTASGGVGWGMTETSALGLGILAEDYIRKPDSAGYPAAICDFRIVNPETLQDVPQGQIGELLIRGPNVMKGYINRPDANKKEFVEPGHWFRTGDLASKDEEGMYYIRDRAKDMLLRGGENIYCVEIEDVLYSHPAIIDAAIVGLPHKILGEEVGAAITLKPGFLGKVSLADIQAFLRGKLAAFKIPVFAIFTEELLPRNAAGKILKRELKLEVVAAYEQSKKAKL